MKYVVVGAGIWGCVIAERIASKLKIPVLVLEKRDHIGGNCYSSIDPETGIECHRYGSHIFHTSLKNVYDYLINFCTFNNYKHKVLTTHQNHVYPMPVNLFTINDFYHKNMNPQEAVKFMEEEISRYALPNPENLEEKAISLIGRPLYEAFIKNYTAKQWERDPKKLPAEIITRIPVRANYDMDYFSDYWQGIPYEGYFSLFKNILANPNIEVRLNCDFHAEKDSLPRDAKIIYTGLPDQLFDYKYGELDWRSLEFAWERLDVRDFQGTAVMNYADASVPFTRIHEFKHYHPERKEVYESGKTIICREYPASFQKGREACYPINDSRNNELYRRYAQDAEKAGIILGGRLGAYKYWDMDKAVANALDVFENRIAKA